MKFNRIFFLVLILFFKPFLVFTDNFNGNNNDSGSESDWDEPDWDIEEESPGAEQSPGAERLTFQERVQQMAEQQAARKAAAEAEENVDVVLLRYKENTSPELITQAIPFSQLRTKFPIERIGRLPQGDFPVLIVIFAAKHPFDELVKAFSQLPNVEQVHRPIDHDQLVRRFTEEGQRKFRAAQKDPHRRR